MAKWTFLTKGSANEWEATTNGVFSMIATGMMHMYWLKDIDSHKVWREIETSWRLVMNMKGFFFFMEEITKDNILTIWKFWKSIHRLLPNISSGAAVDSEKYLRNSSGISTVKSAADNSTKQTPDWFIAQVGRVLPPCNWVVVFTKLMSIFFRSLLSARNVNAWCCASSMSIKGEAGCHFSYRAQLTKWRCNFWGYMTSFRFHTTLECNLGPGEL